MSQESFPQASEPVNPEAPKKVDVSGELSKLEAQFGAKKSSPETPGVVPDGGDMESETDLVAAHKEAYHQEYSNFEEARKLLDKYIDMERSGAGESEIQKAKEVHQIAFDKGMEFKNKRWKLQRKITELTGKQIDLGGGDIEPR